MTAAARSFTVRKDATPREGRRAALPRLLLWPGAILAGLVVWELLYRSGAVPRYTLPSSAAVAREWWRLWQNGVLPRDLRTTLREAMLGFGAAFVAGIAIGCGIAKSRRLDLILAPYIAASQAMPVVALAPLFVVWLGLGLLPKVIICALIVVFPILVSTQTGLRGVDRDLVEASWTMGAGNWQTFRAVEVPLALRSVLGGVRMGLTLAMTGAVVGEFVSASAGLGYLMNFGRSIYSAPMVFAAALTIAAVAMIGYSAIAVLERVLIDWE